MAKTVVLVPRDEAKAPLAGSVNAWLEARGDVQRLDADAFVVELSSADMATEAEVATGYDREPLRRIRIEVAAAGIPYGSPLATEVRKLCEELALAFDLVVLAGSARASVGDFFEGGAF